MMRSSMQIGIRQQREETRTLDACRREAAELAPLEQRPEAALGILALVFAFRSCLTSASKGHDRFLLLECELIDVQNDAHGQTTAGREKSAQRHALTRTHRVQVLRRLTGRYCI